MSKMVLPEGWREVRLGDVCRLYQPQTLAKKNLCETGKYKVYGANGVIGRYDEYNHAESEIAITCRGATCGTINFTEPKSWITGNAMVAKNSKEFADKKFLFYVLKVAKMRTVITGGAQPQITREKLIPLKIKLPSLAEQKAIAKILQTWDVAIEKTESLIAAKENQFKGLMKKLISDQFENPNWSKTTLGAIGDISSAGVDKKIIEGEQSVRLVNYLDAYRRYAIFSKDLTHFVTAPSGKAKKCSVRKGDIFFTPSSEIRLDIGNSAVAMEDIPDAVYSYHIVRLRPTIKMDLLFSVYAFKTHFFYKQVSRFAEGSGQRYVVSQNYFRKTRVALPPLAEQKRIGQILNTARREIDLLRKLAEKHRVQKRGLMQKLLTGEWSALK